MSCELDDQTNRLDRIAHEVVHFRLREAYGEHLPLWLEEGLATLMGMNVARRFNSAQGRDLAGTWPALPVEALLEPDQLLTMDHYPSSPGAAQAYRAGRGGGATAAGADWLRPVARGGA